MSNFTVAIGNTSSLYEEMENMTCEILLPYKSNIGLQEYVFLVVSFLIFFIGIFSNSCLIYLVVSSPKMRTIPNVFITNLAAGDVIFLLFHVPTMAPSHIQSQWTGGVHACKAVHCVRFTTLGVSVFTLMVLAIDRYRAITRPVRSSYKSSLHGLSCVIITLAIIWISSILLSLPITLNAFVDQIIVEVNRSDNVQTCLYIQLCSPFDSQDARFISFIVWFKFIVYFAVPCCVFAVFYGLMASFLYRSSYALPADGARTLQQQRHLQARRKLAKIILGLVLVFVICWLPEQTHMIQWYLGRVSYQIWKFLAKILTSVYACINPITLCVLSHSFRNSYYRLVCFLCQRGRIRERSASDPGVAMNTRNLHYVSSLQTRFRSFRNDNITTDKVATRFME